MKTDIEGKVAPENIDMLTKIIEAYDHLGIVSTLDNKEGRIIIRGTADTLRELEMILAFMPFVFEITE